MTVSAINFSGKTNSTNSINEIEQNQKTTESKHISKTAIGVGLVGLAALASVGIYLATKGKIGKPSVKPKVTPKNEETVENVKQKMEEIIESFNKGQFKNAPKSIKQLKNGKTTITLGEGSNRTVYIYDKNANPEKQINFVNKGYATSVPTENGQWKLDKVKRRDVKTGDTIIEKFGAENPKTGSIKSVETTTISRKQSGDLSEFKKHKYTKNDNGVANEDVVSINTMKFGDDTVRTVRKANLKPNESPEWNVEKYVIKNNERIDKPLKDVIAPEQMQKWASALGL